jgi:hypothetical protein
MLIPFWVHEFCYNNNDYDDDDNDNDIIFVYFINYRSDFNLINENIELVLGISLIKKPSENELNSIDITCGICYSYQNPYEVPSENN